MTLDKIPQSSNDFIKEFLKKVTEKFEMKNSTDSLAVLDGQLTELYQFEESSKAIEKSQCLALRREKSYFGFADVMLESDEIGFYLLQIRPGGVIYPHAHKMLRELELTMTQGLYCNGRPIEKGFQASWALDEIHSYFNPTFLWQSVLCVDSPSFNAEDEKEIFGYFS